MTTTVQSAVPATAAPPMLPTRYVVAARRTETHDTVTLTLHPAEAPIETPTPGQFTMLYAYGMGEVPVSVSGSRRAVRPGARPYDPRGGHCQLGPLLVCRDGPVVGYDQAAPLFAIKEL